MTHRTARWIIENDGNCSRRQSVLLAKEWLSAHPETPAKPADPRRYEIAKAALEKLATYKGLWDGDRYSIDEGSVNGIAKEALALIADLDKETEK